MVPLEFLHLLDLPLMVVEQAALMEQLVLNNSKLADRQEHLVVALRAVETNGGGIVYFPRGRYSVTNTIAVPSNTVLRGESMALTSLYWPDYEKPPRHLVDGTNFGVEAIALAARLVRPRIRPVLSLSKGPGDEEGKTVRPSPAAAPDTGR